MGNSYTGVILSVLFILYVFAVFHNKYFKKTTQL